MAVTRAQAYTLAFPMYTAADPTVLASGLTLAIIVSKDGGVFTAAMNAATEPGGQGVYSLLLTAAEMDADMVVVVASAATAVDQVVALVTDADIRAAVGLAAANLDTQLAALPTDADVNAACDTAITDAALATAAALATVDAAVDAILEDTGTTLPATLSTIDGHVSDTFDDVGGVQSTVDAILADTNELQTDWHDGGRLDLIADAIKAKTDTLGAAAVTITNPVAADLTVTVTEGDDYDADHGLQIVIPVADSSHLLGLDDVAAVVKLVFEEGEWIASGVASTADGYDCTFEPTAAETGALTLARQQYQLRATLADEDITTRTFGMLVRVAKVG